MAGSRRKLLASAATGLAAATVAALPAVAGSAGFPPAEAAVARPAGVSPAGARPDPLPALWRHLERADARLEEIEAERTRIEAALADEHGALAREREAVVTFPVEKYDGGSSDFDCFDLRTLALLAPAGEADGLRDRLLARRVEVAAFREAHGLARLDRAWSAWARRWNRLEERLAMEPATTAEGVAVKVRLLVRSMHVGGVDHDDDAARTALEALERLGGEAVHA